MIINGDGYNIIKEDKDIVKKTYLRKMASFFKLCHHQGSYSFELLKFHDFP